MRALVPRCLLVLGLASVATGIACAASPRTFDLPEHGSLVLAIPDGWDEQTRQPPQGLPPTLSFTAHSGASFQVFVTAVWPLKPGAALGDAAAMKTAVAEAAKAAQPEAVERSLPIEELTGTSGRGYYFFATDRAPKPGEFKYIDQGIIRVGAIELAFTVLTNDGQDAIAKAALEMLCGARQNIK